MFNGVIETQKMTILIGVISILMISHERFDRLNAETSHSIESCIGYNSV